MMIASLTKPTKLASSLSYRVAVRHHCLSLAKKPSPPKRCHILSNQERLRAPDEPSLRKRYVQAFVSEVNMCKRL